jgi:hypothetical protein
MVLAIYQIILHPNKITECLKMTTFKIVFTLDVFFSAETMHCKVTCYKVTEKTSRKAIKNLTMSSASQTPALSVM